jgi:hypothetical protein
MRRCEIRESKAEDRGQLSARSIERGAWSLNIQYPTRNRRVKKFSLETGYSVLNILRFKSFQTIDHLTI